MTITLYLSAFIMFLVAIVIWQAGKIAVRNKEIKHLENQEIIKKRLAENEKALSEMSDDDLWDNLSNHANSLPVKSRE